MPAILKPVKRATVKRRKQRQARTVVTSIREQCFERDGYCRFFLDTTFGVYCYPEGCKGPSEWAHLGEKKRFKTRGQPPEERHTTGGSLMLCRFHHHAYDRGDLAIIGADANLTLRFEWK